MEVVTVKYGAFEIALKVARMVVGSGSSLFLAFSDNLSNIIALSHEVFVVACAYIQKLETDLNDKRGPRFIIPAVAIMKRAELVQRLAEFVRASNIVL